ncbi:hypothetical protein FQR65_LT18294 [Abscondita terminalis]|nr:hypothetical protein FQR65_LT18294 [Abscondita terminalis]
MNDTDIVTNLEDLKLEDVDKIPALVISHNSSKADGDMGPKELSEILKLLESVGYTGSLLSENELNDALQTGPKSLEFANLVNF